MEEVLCTIDIIKENETFTAKIQSEFGGYRPMNAPTIEELLEQIYVELQEEFDTI